MTGSRPSSGNHRPALASPRAILLWVCVAILVALGLYAAAPWILPARIYEGPMVQMAAEDGITLIWYTTRPAACDVLVTVDGKQRTESATADGRRQRVRIAGLEPGTTYAYEIRTGGRPLTADLTFQTNRPLGAHYTFLVFGDSGLGGRAQYLLAAEMGRAQPPADFLLHTGDQVYPDGARRRYEERFFAPYRHLLTRVGFWACLGNHDVKKSNPAKPEPGDDGAPAYEEIFDLPQNGPPGLPAGHNYWFDYASCRIAVIDSNITESLMAKKVAPWLEAVMADPAPHWKFVALHHPPYTGARHKPDARVQRVLVPVFDAAGVDVVFSGHDHLYERMHPMRGGQIVTEGASVLYIVTGAGGGELYEMKEPRPAYIAAFDDHDYSFTQVTIDGDELSLRQIALDGHVIDNFTLQKPPMLQEQAVPASAPATAPGA
jgi:acid phosphatase type 7